MASSLVLGLSAINIAGALWGGWAQAVTTIIKGGFVAFVALLPLAMEALGYSVLDAARFSERVTPLQPSVAAQAAAVLLAVLWAYNGWEGVAPVAEEIRNPTRNIPIALFGGIGILALLYLGATVAYHSVIPMEEMIVPENRQHVAELMVKRLLGPVGGTLMSVGIMLSTLGTINSNLLLYPRVTYAMGRDGSFFPIFGEVHVRFRTPVAAILLQAIMTVTLITISAVLIEFVPYFRNHSIFNLLTDSVVFACSIFYALAVGAVVVLRRTQPDVPRPFRTPFYPVIPIAYLLVNAWFLYHVFLGQPVEAVVGLVLIGLGLPVYWWFRSRQVASVSVTVAEPTRTVDPIESEPVAVAAPTSPM